MSADLPDLPDREKERNAELLKAAGQANHGLAVFLAEIVLLRTRVVELERAVSELRKDTADE